MKFGLCLAVGALAISTSAFAADLPTKKEAPVAPPPPPFSWTGFYLGVYAGGAFGGPNMQEINGIGELAFLPGQLTAANLHPNAFVGGAFAGYNYEFPSAVVLGGEAEFGGSAGNVTGVTNSGVIPGAPAIENNIPTYNKFDQTWVFRARARLGYAMGSFLPFVAGGVSVTNASLGLTFPCPNFPDPGITTYTASATKSFTGFNIGAGVDWAVTQNVVLRAEYIFDGYGAPQLNYDATQGWNNRKLANFTENTFRLAASFKF